MNNLDLLIQRIEEYIKSERYEDLLDKFLYNELSSKPQIPVDTPDEFTSNDLSLFVKEDEVFTSDKDYLKTKSNFIILDDSGELIIEVKAENEVEGGPNFRFRLPIESEEDKKNLAFILLYLQNCSAVKFSSNDLDTN